MFDMRENESGLVAHGVSACAGCGLELVIRNVLAELGEDTIVVIPPGCSALFCGTNNESGIKIPAFQGNLESSAAYATGISRGLRHKGNTHTTVLCFCGDGGTIDIGLQSLSGMIERGEDVLYVCYDNEAYMNTGIQASSSTPFGAWSTTTPAGKSDQKKDLLGIAIAHNIPYCATASAADVRDLRKKVAKAKGIRGPRLIHVHTPCPTGWRSEPGKSIEICRNAIESNAWVLYEYEGGRLTINKKPKNRKPITEYMRLQGRFKALSDADIESIQKTVDASFELLCKKEELYNSLNG